MKVFALSADSELASYTTVTTLPVQWGDMDAFGHVNNVVYFRWFESARIDLLELLSQDVTMKGSGLGPILVSAKCDYRRQLHFPDTVHVGSKIGKVGRTSAEIHHAVYSQQQDVIVAEGISVMVVFDYDAHRPVRIPEDLRKKMQLDESS
ncbi:MAG: thioesterase family protein [Fuerstiella sp.]